MDTIAEAIAKNYYLQAIAIAVAVGTLLAVIYKSAKWLLHFFHDVVSVGINRTLRNRKVMIMKAAFQDSKDPVLYVSRVVAIVGRLGFTFILLLIVLSFPDVPTLRSSDRATFGLELSGGWYVAIGAAFQLLSVVLVFRMLSKFAELRFHAKYVRRRRLRELKKSKS
jgi:hypothetical protein